MTVVILVVLVTGSFGQSDAKHDTAHTATRTQKPGGLSGTYKRIKHLKDENQSATLEIKLIGNTRIWFHLTALWWSVGNDSPHNGEIEATVELHDHSATYTSNDYRLTLHFEDNTVALTESGSNSDFGANVHAAGKYRRTSPDRPPLNGKRASSAEQVVSPGRGSAMRAMLLNLLRPAVEKDLRQPVIFRVDTIRVFEGWAFILGDPLQPDKKPIDYSKTVYREAYQHGAFSGNCCALLHRSGGRWKLVTYHLGATDVFWENWPQRFQAPARLFQL